jgi:hypothetical protein
MPIARTPRPAEHLTAAQERPAARELEHARAQQDLAEAYPGRFVAAGSGYYREIGEHSAVAPWEITFRRYDRSARRMRFYAFSPKRKDSPWQR